MVSPWCGCTVELVAVLCSPPVLGQGLSQAGVLPVAAPAARLAPEPLAPGWGSTWWQETWERGQSCGEGKKWDGEWRRKINQDATHLFQERKGCLRAAKKSLYIMYRASCNVGKWVVGTPSRRMDGCTTRAIPRMGQALTSPLLSAAWLSCSQMPT